MKICIYIYIYREQKQNIDFLKAVYCHIFVEMYENMAINRFKKIDVLLLFPIPFADNITTVNII